MVQKFKIVAIAVLLTIMPLVLQANSIEERQLNYKPTKIQAILTSKPIIETPKPVVISTPVTVVKTAYATTSESLNNDEVALLARLIQAESLSEPYEGKLWVGSVVINRMRVYSKSMSEVIYEKSQFAGTKGRLFNTSPSDECVQAAKDVLSGNITSKEVLYFVDLRLCNPSWINNVVRMTKINRHTFYKAKEKTGS